MHLTARGFKFLIFVAKTPFIVQLPIKVNLFTAEYIILVGMEDLLVPMLLATLAVGALSAELMGDVVSAIEERVLGMKPQSCALVFVGRFPGLQPEAYYARITYWLR